MEAAVARSKNEDRRTAIMGAATQVISSQGLHASTAEIAKQAGISNGSLFTYFDTKVDLLNQLFVDLKSEMGLAALGGLPERDGMRDQLVHVWSGWTRWASTNPEKRRTLAQLSVSDEISGASRELGHQAMAGVANVLERSRQNSAMRDAPLALVAALIGALADTTVDFMIGDPANAERHCTTGFEAVWRMLR